MVSVCDKCGEDFCEFCDLTLTSDSGLLCVECLKEYENQESKTE